MCDWLLLLNIRFPGFIQLLLVFYSFLPLSSTPCVDIPHCVYPLNRWQTFRLSPPFSCCEYCNYEHFLQAFMWAYVSVSLEYIHSDRSAGTYGNSVSNLLKTARLFFKTATSFYIPSAAYEDSLYYISLSVLMMICFFDCNHPWGTEVVFHCVLDLYFSDS